MAIESYLLMCYEEKQLIELTREMLKIIELKDIFAIIHMMELNYHIIVDIIHVVHNDNVNWDIETRKKKRCSLNIQWSSKNVDLAIMAVMLSYLERFESISVICINNRNYSYKNQKNFIEEAKKAGVINHEITRKLMKALKIQYSNPEESKEFFGHYLGYGNTKSARNV